MMESNQLTLFAGDSHVNRSALPGSEMAKKMTAISGQRCAALSMKQGHLGSLVKMLLESSHWDSMQSYPIWKVLVTPHKRLIYRLMPLDYQRWNGTYGLLPRPTVSDSKGSPKKRFRTSPEHRSNFCEIIRENMNDGLYPRPEFVEWVKGFPDGWTE